jgi:sigma-54 specific flagellar transcriptional regulator A
MSAKGSNSGSGRSSLILRSRLIGSSVETEHIRNLINRVSRTDATVLVQGESGTGKEVIARLVHDLSDRSKMPFVAVNCGAIPSELLESELFGHEKGSFTGAISARKGRFELAEGGTLFLDEIGDMPFSMQVKLLRVLQESCFERVGGGKSLRCDVRVVAATHQNLEQKISENLFRADLYYRLNVFPIEVPPLRSRIDDLPDLVSAFTSTAKKKGRGSIDFSDLAITHLINYAWPGNVRELINLIERLMVLYPGQLVTDEELPAPYRAADLTHHAPPIIASEQLELLDHIPLNELHTPVAPLPTDGAQPVLLSEPVNLKAKLAEVERDYIIAALEQTDWVTAHAASWLKLQRTTLVEKMRKYEISR